ncbi:hypothetical protein WMY93_027191 [Mugilogobius chulae]|uniref:Protein Flattop n=1 Tax=Mugilogobius chulae TaxID=88201 RepID=A0AAW0MWV6_9GOBI
MSLDGSDSRPRSGLTPEEELAMIHRHTTRAAAEEGDRKQTRAQQRTDVKMSLGFSANQYDNAFKSQRLQNWCQPKHFKERPAAKSGSTSFIVNDRGHLIPGLKQRNSSWPDFKGTWDLPTRIPANRICPTARSEQGLSRLRTWGFSAPRPDTAPAPGGDTEKERNNADREGDTQRDKLQPEQAEAVTHEREREKTPTTKLSATGRDSATNMKQAEAAEEKETMCE